MGKNKLIKLTDEELVAEVKFELKEMVRETKAVEVGKINFVNEIKSGLGQKIKNNPRGIKIIEKKWYEKLGLLVKNIFTKF
jgi:hypothetical protein